MAKIIRVEDMPFDCEDGISLGGGPESIDLYRVISHELDDQEMDTDLTYVTMNVAAALGYDCPMPEGMKAGDEIHRTLRQLISRGYLEDNVLVELRDKCGWGIEFVDNGKNDNEE